jgi:hypothetical protein
MFSPYELSESFDTSALHKTYVQHLEKLTSQHLSDPVDAQNKINETTIK